MKRSHTALLYIIITLTLLMCAVIIALLVLKPNSIPKFSATVKVDPEKVNYNVVDGIIQDKLSRITIPKPRDGRDGDSVKGDSVTGARGTSCTTSQAEGGAMILCEDGASAFIKDGTNGDKGDTGENGKTPFTRCNTAKNRWEIRYDEADAWMSSKDQNGKDSPCRPSS